MIVICAVLLVLIVLVQNSKGGGLSSSFGQGNQVMGVKKTADFLEKATWTLAIGLVVFCLLASFSIPVKKEKQVMKTEQPLQQQAPQGNSEAPIE